MPLRTIKVKGKLSGDETKKNFTLTYELGTVEAICSGRWEMAVASVSFFFGPETTSWNTIFEVSSNYIDCIVPSQNGTKREPMTLTLLRVKGAPGDRVVLGFKSRDFFEITTPSRNFCLYWQDLNPNEPPVGPLKERSVEVTVLLLLRRIQ